jgi:hypothetical protein
MEKLVKLTVNGAHPESFGLITNAALTPANSKSNLKLDTSQLADKLFGDKQPGD